MNEIKNLKKINSLKIQISELTGKIYEIWIKDTDYHKKDSNGDFYYINGGWKTFESKNADCIKRTELERELKVITPPLTIKEKLKQEGDYMKSCGLLKNKSQQKQWRETKKGLINFHNSRNSFKCQN